MTKPIQTVTDRPKHPQEKMGLALMIAGFVVLALAATALVFQSRGTLPPGNVGRHLLIVGLGIYIIGRLIYWQKRKAGR